MSQVARAFGRRFIAAALALLFAGSIGVSSAPAHANTTKATVESVSAMLKKAGFKFTLDGDVYLLFFEEKGIGKFPMVIAIEKDLMLITTQIARADKMTRSPELSEAVLAANWTYGLLKLVFDPKGNLVFRYAISEKMVDADDLKELIKAFVENTANIYNNAPFIKK